ncbi:MAG: rane protein [Rhizobacter sp.]|nr:rane protein [Rhizobacter sp.]
MTQTAGQTEDPPAPLAEPAARPRLRFDRLDALRAVAILWMAAFHFGFDLNYFGFIQQNFYTDPTWTLQRTCIVSLFLFCAGFGQAVAQQQGQGWPRFWRRWAQVAACAVLVSIGSYFVFPRSFIYFGVLHGIAVMLVLTRLTAGWGRWLWPLGLVAVLTPQFIAHPFFDTPYTNWVGLITHKPVTEDYVPVLPWLGVMWWGVAAGTWVLRKRPAWVAGALPRALHPVVTLGQWSLMFYMLHQPVLLGLLAAWRAAHRSFSGI